MISKSKRTFDPKIDDENWGILFKLHYQNLLDLDAISSIWLSGFDKLAIDQNKRPLVEELNNSIKPYTGYTFVQTDDSFILNQYDWYTMIANYKMPLTCFLRTPAELSYCDEPDIWHDIMGHIPFLAEREFSDMYQLLAKTYIQAYDAHRSDLLKELDFIGGMLIELGLIREASGIKAFGATFYSSSEVNEAFKQENQMLFTASALRSGESYDRHRFQGKYYIFDSLDHLVSIIRGVAQRL